MLRPTNPLVRCGTESSDRLAKGLFATFASDGVTCARCSSLSQRHKGSASIPFSGWISDLVQKRGPACMPGYRVLSKQMGSHDGWRRG